MATYEVVVTRDGRWWMIAIPALDGLTQARHRGEIEEMARDYIAVTLDAPIADVAVRIVGVTDNPPYLLDSYAWAKEQRKVGKWRLSGVSRKWVKHFR
jgi:hypothetical protein